MEGEDRGGFVGWISAAQPTAKAKIMVGCAALTHPTRMLLLVPCRVVERMSLPCPARQSTAQIGCGFAPGRLQGNFGDYSLNTTASPPSLVPTLRVGMQSSTLRIVRAARRHPGDAGRPGKHSRAERGNVFKVQAFLCQGVMSRQWWYSARSVDLCVESLARRLSRAFSMRKPTIHGFA